MSIRACWIISPGRTGPCETIFYNIFATVEQRTKFVEDEHYVGVADQDDIAKAVEEILALSSSIKGISHSCRKKEQKPVFEIKVPGGTLWPFLIIEQHGYLFCCLPHVEQGSYNRPRLLQIPGLSMGFHFLLGIAEYLGQIPRNVKADWEKFADLYLYVTQAAPFGTPVDLEPTTVKASIMAKSSSTQSTHKVPAWKPLQYKGKSQLYFTIREYIKAFQCEKEEVKRQWEVYGSLVCRADLEGAVPDLSVTLCHVTQGSTAPLDHIIYHPFVQSVETQADFQPGEKRRREWYRYNMRVTPPLDQFTLCHYTANNIPALPICGFYQMKGEEKVELLLQLKLSDGVKNRFEYCEARLPFFNRGSIKRFDASQSHGHVSIASDKTTLIWSLGQKFPNKQGDVQLKATVKFARYTPSLAETPEQQFCLGHNAYVQLYFKMVDFTLSGIQLDQKALQVAPATKYKLTSVREFISSEYKIWNSHGDAPAFFEPDTQLLQEIHLANQQR